MQQTARIAADVTVVLHFGYVAFVVLGLLLVLLGIACRWQWVRNLWFRIAHLAAILIVVGEAWLGITCPLTTLEQWLRHQAGQTGYRGDFLATLVHDLLFYDAPGWVFTAAYTLFGLLVAATFVLAPPRRGTRAQID
jgi:hypothetical protein